MELSDAVFMAQRLMQQNKLDGWKLFFDERKTSLGRCNESSKTIYLSLPYVELNEENIIKDVVLHEIAHALAGCENNHNIIWKAFARKIGANPERCASKETIMPQTTFKLVCNNCNWERPAHRRTKKKRACPECCNKHNKGYYSKEYRLEYKRTRKII